MNQPNIFDLSTAKKLQLVEDLWDLHRRPRKFLFTIGKKRNWQGVKQIYKSILHLRQIGKK